MANTPARGIILVRHAMSDVVRGVPSREWGITTAAHEDCRRLAKALPAGVGPIAASTEPKAEQTARIVAEELGLDVVIDPRLGEVDRPTTWDGDYRQQAASYLGGKSSPRWEQRDAVIERFGDAIIDLASREGSGDLVVVNHGLALSLFLAANLDIDIVPFWQALRFPDAWRFVPGTGELTHVFEDGLPPPDA